MKKILSLCALLIVVLFAYKSYTPHVSAQGTPTVYTAGPVTGWLWSTNVGWISLSCFNAGQGCTSGQPLPANHYGVSQQNDGSWSGYAWSDTLGWLQFGVTPTNCDTSLTSPSCISKVIGNQLYGYAHFVNATTNPTPGFDGWVSFNANNDHDLVNTGVPVPSSTAYGFTFSAPIGMTGTMSVQPGSLAWEGDSVVGWLTPVGIIAPAPCSGSTCTALTLAASPNPVGPNYEVALTIGAPAPTNFGGGAPTAVSWQVGSGSVQTIWKDTTGTTIPLSGITCPSSANATTNINVDAITASITAQTNVTFTVTCNDINGNPITAQTIVTVNPLTLNATSTANLDSCPVSGTAVTSVPITWNTNITDPSNTSIACTAPYLSGASAPAYTKHPVNNVTNLSDPNVVTVSTPGTYNIKCKDVTGATAIQQVTITNLDPMPASGVCLPPSGISVSFNPFSSGSFCPTNSPNPQSGYAPLPQSVGYTVSHSTNVSCLLISNNNATHSFTTTPITLSPINSNNPVNGTVTIPATASGISILRCTDTINSLIYGSDNYIANILPSNSLLCNSGTTGGTTTGTTTSGTTTSGTTTSGTTTSGTTGSGTSTSGSSTSGSGTTSGTTGGTTTGTTTSGTTTSGTTTSGTTGCTGNCTQYSMSLNIVTPGMCPANNLHPTSLTSPTTIEIDTTGYSLVPGDTTCSVFNTTTGTFIGSHDLGVNPDFTLSTLGTYTFTCTDNISHYSHSTLYDLGCYTTGAKPRIKEK